MQTRIGISYLAALIMAGAGLDKEALAASAKKLVRAITLEYIERLWLLPAVSRSR